MEAELLAVGIYSDDIAEHLDYPAEFYKGIRQGAQVIATIISCHSSESSRKLAEALGIDPWDFEQHFLTGRKTPDAIDKLMLEGFDGIFNMDDVASVRILATKGFNFIFRPNG